MADIVTLSYRDEAGRHHQAEISKPQFTIGRNADNDLTIDEQGLSRLHAMIRRRDELVTLIDCGSRNGTFINGRQISQEEILKEGDVISLGTLCEITVNLRPAEVVPSPVSQLDTPQAENPADAATATASPAEAQNNLLLIAAVSAVMILIVATALILLVGRNRRKVISAAAVTPAVEATTEDVTPEPATPSPSTGEARQPCVDIPLTQIEAGAQKVIRQISSDKQEYAFPEEAPLRDIKAEVEKFCGQATLASAISTLRQHQGEIKSATADEIATALLGYAALAQTSGGTRGDVLAATAQMAPVLRSLRRTFGDQTGDSVLIFVAAYPEGVFPKGGHPLLARIRSVTRNDPFTRRNVWYLSRNGALKPEQYAFIVRFLAAGIIARNPAEYGLSTAALE